MHYKKKEKKEKLPNVIGQMKYKLDTKYNTEYKFIYHSFTFNNEN